MVRRGGYRTSAQKEGRSAGQRKKRNLRQAKRNDRANNVWPIRASVNKTPNASRFDNPPVYGIYKDEDNRDWVLTIMSCVRKEEVPSGHNVRRATISVVRGRYILKPRTGGEHQSPYEGLEVERFGRKKDAMNKVRAEASTRVGSGEYLINAEHDATSRSWKVDRDEYADWKRQRSVVRVRHKEDQTSRH